jgi:hypothetical protein
MSLYHQNFRDLLCSEFWTRFYQNLINPDLVSLISQSIRNMDLAELSVVDLSISGLSLSDLIVTGFSLLGIGKSVRSEIKCEFRTIHLVLNSPTS